MSIQKIVIGFIVIAIFLSLAVFPGYAYSQGKDGNGSSFQERNDDTAEEMLRLRDEKRKQVREGSVELGREVQERNWERKQVIEQKRLEERERVQTQE
jgi:hypothetical protein